GPSSGLRPLPHVTMDRRRYTWHLRRTTIGRAESRCGMGTGAFGRTLLSEFANNSPRGASPNSETVGGPPSGFALSSILRVFLVSIRWTSDRAVKLLPHFISDPTILHADDDSPHADWIFERTLLLRQVLRISP